MILQAWETLPSCLASSSRPALARMIFWSLVMTVSSGWGHQTPSVGFSRDLYRMSPALSLASNPVALRRALETGGVSLADGWRNLMGDVQQGKLTMVDATAFQPGRNLAV